MYPRPGLRSISLITSWAASPAPTTSASLPRATTWPGRGRSISVRASRREPATNARHSSRSTNHTPVGTRAGWISNSVNTRKVAIEAKATPRTAAHMSRVEM